MIFGLFLLGVITAIYFLFVKGWLFKLLLFGFGWIGMFVVLWINVPDTHHIAFRTNTTGYTWAAVIPTIVCLLALATTKSD